VRILMATLFLLPTLSLSSEEEQDPMPASAKRTVAQHDREVQRLKERYLSDLAEIREDTLRDLERDMEKTTRRGDLEGALAIKEKITALEEQEEEIAEAPTDFLGNAVRGSSSPGTLYVMADERSVVRVNGEKVLQTYDYHRLYEAPNISIGPGDTVAVEYTNEHGPGGVTLAFVTREGFGFGSKEGRWKVCSETAPTAEQVCTGVEAQRIPSDGYDQHRVRRSSRVASQRIQAPGEIGTFVLAIVVQRSDFSEVQQDGDE